MASFGGRALALWLVGIAGNAAAQPAPTPQTPPAAAAPQTKSPATAPPASGTPTAAPDDARSLFERGSTLYALGRYAQAAPLFERAFELKPDPALLYNAAQAYRFMGNKTRALTLYQNYFRLYGDRISNADEVRRQIEQLKETIAADERAKTAPPTDMQKPAPPPSRLKPALNIPPYVDEVILKMVAKAREDRFPDTNALREHIARVLKGADKRVDRFEAYRLVCVIGAAALIISALVYFLSR